MTNTFNPVQTNVKFLKEWTPTQFKDIEKAIAHHFRGRLVLTLHNGRVDMRTFSAVDKTLGLAYTSSGIWACYGICNTEVYFDADKIYSYQYFTIGENGGCYAVLQDKDENELVILL